MNDIIDKIAAVFKQYELFYVKERSKKIEARDGEICSAEYKEEEGYALRAIDDSRPVFAYTYDRNDPAARLTDNAQAILPAIEKDKDSLFAGSNGQYPPNSFYDSPGIAVSDDEKRSKLLEMEKIIREFDPRIKTVRNCEFQESEASALLQNSKGIAAQGNNTLFVYSAMAVAGEGGDEVSWFDWRWANNFAELDARQMGIDIAGKVISILGAEQMPTGTYEGIFTPRAASDLLGILSESFLAESLYKDKTQLKGKEGALYFSDKLTIHDSGLAGTDAFPFDGEGMPSADNLVVEKGVFRTFLYDTYFGRKFNKSSTGNSVRPGLKSPPKCGIRGMFIEKGSRDIQAFLTNGIIVEDLMGTHTANAITGDFSVGCLGYRVHNGTRTPIQGVMISGNVFDIFKHVTEVGNDLTFYGSVGTPSLYAEGLKISGT